MGTETINPLNHYTMSKSLLTDLGIHHKGERGMSYHLYQCECGNQKVSRKYPVESLRVVSCGCVWRNFAKEGKLVKDNLRMHSIFKCMKGRCNYKSNPSYKNYGARGIKMMWETFTDFHKDMNETYYAHVALHGEKQTTIDRIDVQGNYSKENCRWATWKEQNNNKQKDLKPSVNT